MFTKPPPVEKLTTRDAWAQLALWWDKATRCPCRCGRVVVAPCAAGLCSTLAIFRHRGLIDEFQEQYMLASLPRRGPEFVPGVRPWLWPTDEAGAKQRAAFCREQAKTAVR